MEKNNLVKTVIQSGVASSSASAISGSTTAAKHVTQTSALNILKDQFKVGGARACFRGLAPSLAGIVPHSGIYFALYAPVKKLCHKRRLSDGASAATAAMVAGGFANVVTNPVWVVKSRMSSKPQQYPKMVNAFAKILKEEGSRGFCSGMGASALGVSHVVVQFPLYEMIKQEVAANAGRKTDDLLSITVASTVSKLAASGVTYPLEVIRTQMQTYGETGSKAAIDRTKKIWTNYKTSGFFRGFSVSMVKSVPSTVITLYLYEKLMDSVF